MPQLKCRDELSCDFRMARDRARRKTNRPQSLWRGHNAVTRVYLRVFLRRHIQSAIVSELPSLLSDSILPRGIPPGASSSSSLSRLSIVPLLADRDSREPAAEHSPATELFWLLPFSVLTRTIACFSRGSGLSCAPVHAIAKRAERGHGAAGASLSSACACSGPSEPFYFERAPRHRGTAHFRRGPPSRLRQEIGCNFHGCPDGSLRAAARAPARPLSSATPSRRPRLRKRCNCAAELKRGSTHSVGGGPGHDPPWRD
jgi:hypothetical protein